MDPEIKLSISRLFRKFLLLHALLFAVSTVLALVFTAHFKHRLAGQLAAAARDQLLSGDTRQVLSIMPGSMSRDFSGMSWLPAAEGQHGFSVPESAAVEGGLLRAEAGVRLFFDDQGRFPAGRLLFYYSRLQALLPAAAAWLAVLLLTLPVAFRERARLIADYDLLLKLRVKESYASLAAQVAHDIRSPLAALGAAAAGLEVKPEQRDLVDGAVLRIQGIADDLLRRYRGGEEPRPAQPRAQALARLTEQVVAEKRLQYGGRPGVRIGFSGGQDGARAAVDAREYQRAISNLVNNAVEALGDGGIVSVSLSSGGGSVRIEVRDDGKGIPPEILSRLGAKGETHGKAGGTGLGLYHARAAAERWGGTLSISSSPGGTTVEMRLPAAAAAERPAMRAVLLDDDKLVHMNWRTAARTAGAELHAFSDPRELKAALDGMPRDTPIFIDSDLGDGVRGEDVAAELREKGFEDISMATGHGPEKFSHLPWLKVSGKEPPWA